MTTPTSTDLTTPGHLFTEIVSGRDLSRFDEIVAPDFVNPNASAAPGRQGVRKPFESLLAGVPDLKAFADEVFIFRR